MGKGFRLCCAIGAVMILVSATATAKAEEHCVSDKQAYRNLYVRKNIREGSYFHVIDADGTLCNNTFRCQSHVEACRDIQIPERRYSNRGIQRYTRKIYLDSYCCTSCGYVFSEEELEYLLSLEAQDAGR